MKIKYFLLSLLVVSSVALADEVKSPSATNVVVKQAGDLIESTVNYITKPFLSDKDVECLARNIFYEAGSESAEGKIAVGMVTINRAQDSRFGSSVCEVVKARTVVVKSREIKKSEMVKVGFFGRPEMIIKTETVKESVPICQFSWYCQYTRKPKPDDERWIESQQIAENIAAGQYLEYRQKYIEAMYFHAAGIRPVWAKSKKLVSRTGRHIFYGESKVDNKI